MQTSLIFYNRCILLKIIVVLYGACVVTVIVEDLQGCKKTVARIIWHDGYNQSSHDMFNTLNWDRPELRIRKRRLAMVSKSLNDLAYMYMNEVFTFWCDTRSHYLRSSGEGKKTYLVHKDWNQLPM